MKKHIVGFLLDTNICIAYIKACSRTENKQTSAQKQVFKKLESIKGEMTLCMSEVTLGELLLGAEKSQNKEKNLERIEILEKTVTALSVDRYVWEIFAKLKAGLEKKGKPMSDMDTLIAATAKRYNLVLVSNDTGMKNMDFIKEELSIERENWIQA